MAIDVPNTNMSSQIDGADRRPNLRKARDANAPTQGQARPAINMDRATTALASESKK